MGPRADFRQHRSLHHRRGLRGGGRHRARRPAASQVRAKVQEELAELDRALAALAGRGFDARARESVADELGDLLFSIVNWSRHLELDAEAALRAASAKFERRFAAMEALARARAIDLKQLSAAEWDE